MLLDLDGKHVNRNPHREEYNSWCSRISDEDFQAMEQAINNYCDRHNEIRSSFIPGKDETIKRLFPTLTEACNGNEEDAGLFFGNIVWRVVDGRADSWYFKPSDRDDEHSLGMFYWKKDR